MPTIKALNPPRKHANYTIWLQNFIFQHYYVMPKNINSIEIEQRYLCRVLDFNSQNLMLIRPPNDNATFCSTY